MRPTVMCFVVFLTCLTMAVGCRTTHREEELLAGDARAVAASAAHFTEARSGGIIWRVSTDRKVVALTFDDGPGPKYTPAVLALARKRGIKFTFFLVGKQIQLHPDLARQEIAEGHVIGNHTWDHPTMTYDTAREDIGEIERCEDEIERICGKRTHLFRPPKGMWDGDTFLAADSLGYKMILWSVTLEHHNTKTPEAMAQRVLDRIRPGMIILAHDGEPGHRVDRSRTIKALPILLEGLKARGYELVTVPELIELEKK